MKNNTDYIRYFSIKDKDLPQKKVTVENLFHLKQNSDNKTLDNNKSLHQSELSADELNKFGLKNSHEFHTLANPDYDESSYGIYAKNNFRKYGKVYQRNPIVMNNHYQYMFVTKKLEKPKSYEYPEKLTKKQLIRYRKEYALIQTWQRKRLARTDGYGIIAIPQTREQYVRLFGSQQNVSNVVKWLKADHIIQIFDDYYCYGWEGKRVHRIDEGEWIMHDTGILYGVDYENEQKFVNYCKIHNIEPWTEKDNPEHIIEKNLLEYLWLQQEKIICGRTKLVKPKWCTNGEFENAIIAIFNKKYPQAVMINENNDVINQANAKFFGLCKDDVMNRARPSIHWNKDRTSVICIGYRNTNNFSSFTKTKKPNEICRYDFLKDYHFDKYQYDVTSSVPRNLYLINNGIWEDSTHDFYYDIYKDLKHYGYISRLDYEEARPYIKKLVLICNFSKSSLKNTANFIFNLKDKKSRQLARNVKKDIKQLFTLVKHSINVHIGSANGTEIFLHESALYSMVQYELLTQGIHSIICYDAFYTDTELSDDYMENLIKKCAVEYYNTYILRTDRKHKFSETFNQFISKYNYPHYARECIDLSDNSVPSIIINNIYDNIITDSVDKFTDYYNTYFNNVDLLISQGKVRLTTIVQTSDNNNTNRVRYRVISPPPDDCIGILSDDLSPDMNTLVDLAIASQKHIA